jgi:ribose transport system ATP-binding protein
MKIAGPAVTDRAGPDGISVICYLLFVIRPEGPHPMPPILSLTGISKQFPGVRALDSVDFSLFPGEVHALMGENGAGKSTLINIISGLLHPTSGKICVAGEEVAFASATQAQKAGISTITQEFNLVPQLTVAENIFLGREPTARIGLLNWREIKRHASEVLHELGLNVPLGQRVGYLSVGDRQLVEIAKALSMEFRIITMDEPTAALNAAEVARLFEIIERLKRRGISVLYVSHRLGEIFRIADRVTVLRDGKRVDTRPLNRLTENDLVTMMLGRALKKEAAIYQEISVSEKAALSVHNIAVPGLLADVSFDLRVGEVMGCAGLVGSGRYELTRALFGLLQISGGEVQINGQPVLLASASDAIRHGIYMLPEERKVEGIFPELTVRENLLISAKRLFRRLSELLINAREEEKQYEGMRNSLDIRASSSAQKIIKLSGGNQQKVMLGRALMSNSRILLLNEPTRGVDVGTRVEIHAAIRKLAQSGYAIIVSSSDIPELVSVSDRCLVLSAGRTKGLLDRAQISEDNITALAIGQEITGDNQ